MGDVVVGFCRLVERLRVWENTVEGASSNSVSNVVAMGFKVVFSSAAVLKSNRFSVCEGDCTKDRGG